jgi:hypothetical protein
MKNSQYEPLLSNGHTMDDFDRVLWKLKMLYQEAKYLYNSATKDDNRKKDEVLQFSLSNHSLILVCKFLELYSQFNSFSKTDERVKKVAIILKPVLDRINKNWPRLRDYRNWVLAHPYSINNTNYIVPPWKLLEEEIAPNFVAEKYVLLECARYSIVTIIISFSEKFKLISSTFDYSEEQKPNTSKGAKNGAEAEFERRKIIEELNLGMKQLGIDLNNPLFKEFL